ncbi:Translation machinery-associated protein 16 [Carpediemonas membranifera]|uniref:Translation machinery-associated protein 16 n=1 Tax=Carpediemonas membranifera TaxID=201153 RepID=A0A8J6BAC8_9EUKA|nr:Translation machinery-associated protein 16 [Carpediemonas membranifera]|eukprot:KAG9397444.1 Translation machinery-associated protein 16 [Carpediemonas membranifera]
MPKREANPNKILHPKSRKVAKIKRLEQRITKVNAPILKRQRNASDAKVFMCKYFKMQLETFRTEDGKVNPLPEAEAVKIVSTFVHRNDGIIASKTTDKAHSKWDLVAFEHNAQKEKSELASGFFEAPDLTSKKGVRALLEWDEMGHSTPALVMRKYKG